MVSTRGSLRRLRCAGALLVSLAALVTPVEGQQKSLAASAPVLVWKERPAEAARRGISGVVRIAPALVDRIESNDVLFVYARAVNGDPKPLAVLRKRAQELPVAFFLDDSIAINPARLPSQHNELVISARIVRRGSLAAPAAGDLQGVSAPVRFGEVGVVIVIDSEVK